MGKARPMEDTATARVRTSAHPRSYGALLRPNYHHHNVSAALREAAREIVEAGNPQRVALRDLERRIGISPAAAYRHFTGKDDLMALVAIDGFRELTAALQAAANGPDPGVEVGLAYVEFALANRGMFRLMFGPLLAQRGKYAALRAAAASAFEVIERSHLIGEKPQNRERATGFAAWVLVHGLSMLLIENVVPSAEARQKVRKILASGAHARADAPAIARGRTNLEALAVA
jgi:AcrR family transcriptional regulator